MNLVLFWQMFSSKPCHDYFTHFAGVCLVEANETVVNFWLDDCIVQYVAISYSYVELFFKGTIEGIYVGKTIEKIFIPLVLLNTVDA